MPDTFLSKVDHLVYATPDLAAGVRRIERLLGIRAAPGGQHPGWGTRNALVGLGGETYLEILGPDPDQPGLRGSRLYDVDRLQEPRLVTWVAKGSDLDRLVQDAARRGVELGKVLAGSRKQPDGTTLSWRLTDPFSARADGVIPFFIEWGDTPHPAKASASGCTLTELRVAHPDAHRVKSMLADIGLDLPVEAATAPAVMARLETPRGPIELR